MYDSDGICWHQSGRERCRIDHVKLRDGFFFYGRCKSGQRWFWLAYDFRQDKHEREAFGWQDTEQAAIAAARAAIVRLADGHKAFAVYRAGFASMKLKEINTTAKRAARPPSNTIDSKFVEYLYGYRYHDMDGQGDGYIFKRFQITKKTAKRIFYLNAGERIDEHDKLYVYDHGRDMNVRDGRVGFVNRQKLEADGEVYNEGRHWSSIDYHLYASMQIIRDKFAKNEARLDAFAAADLKSLKAAMAAAHPDRGGSNAAFIAARKAYVDAKRASRYQ